MYTQSSIKFWSAGPKEREKLRRHPFILLSNASLGSQGSHDEKENRKFVDDEPSLQSIETKLTSTSSYDSCIKSPDSVTKEKKVVTFDTVEIREHPRILGDNPCVKSGPSLSIGWFQPKLGRHIKYAVEDFEAERSLTRRPKSQSLVLTCQARKRIIKEETGVSSRAIRDARKEANSIRHSRQQNNLWLYREMEDAAIVLEGWTKTVRQFLREGSATEWEFRELMAASARAERAKKAHYGETVKISAELKSCSAMAA